MADLHSPPPGGVIEAQLAALAEENAALKKLLREGLEWGTYTYRTSPDAKSSSEAFCWVAAVRTALGEQE
jgi:hypothetical protein